VLHPFLFSDGSFNVTRDWNNGPLVYTQM